MRISKRILTSTICSLLVASAVLPTFSAQAAPFEFRDGDRVLLLGDALLERENTSGQLELALRTAYPKTKFSVRNLAWSGDTPKGWSRASFDAPEKGFDRLKEQIALVKPTVVILGYGMAASLQEMTDLSRDPALNADPARYGAEPMSAPRFKKELGELMDAINADASAAGGQPVRFILLTPIKHTDVRKTRPGTPDPAPHNVILSRYAAAVKELAAERNARCIDLSKENEQFFYGRSEDGIHISEKGQNALGNEIAGNLTEEEIVDEIPLPEVIGGVAPKAPPTRRDILLQAILRKNDLFFHRTRPANSTYLFGFRKHEQGRNAAEIPQFDPLVESVDAEIQTLQNEITNGKTSTDGTPVPTHIINLQTTPNGLVYVIDGVTLSKPEGLESVLAAIPKNDSILLRTPANTSYDAV